jgi:hypothetical protein
VVEQFNTMKRILFILLLLATPVLAQPPLAVRLTFTYPTNEIVATNAVYRLYTSADPTVAKPLWTFASALYGTNFSGIASNQYIYFITNSVTPGERYWYITASNFWNASLQSNPSTVASTPPLLTVNSNLAIEKAW